MTIRRCIRISGRIVSRSSALGLIAILASLVLWSATALAAPPEVKKPPPPLTAAWWQTFLAISGNPLDRCDLGTRDVVFLAGTTGGAAATRSCTIPAGKSILVPLINTECSTAEGNGNNPAQLRACAKASADQFTDLSLAIDNVPVRDLVRFRVHSEVFPFTAAEGNVFAVPAGTTRPRSVADGYWALIGPLPSGTHTISFGGSYPPGNFTTLATYNLTVTS